MHFPGSSTAPPRRHHHHNNNYPPQEYTDLSKEDIKQLAPLFKVGIQNHSPALKNKIASLPSHLRCKFPALSTFCSRHDKINPLPIISILEVIQHEVSPANLARKHVALGSQYSVLQEVNAIWTKPKDFRNTFARDATDFSYHEHKCSACRLSSVAKDIPTLIALGGLVIADIKPRNWKQSKRIQWMESWIKASSGQEADVMAMWDLGVEAVVKDPDSKHHPRTKGKANDSREYIDDFIAVANNPDIDLSDVPYVAPKTQYAGYGERNPFADEYERERMPTTAGVRSSQETIRHTGLRSSQETVRPTSEETSRPPTASSVYSQSVSGTPNTSTSNSLRPPTASSIYSQSVDGTPATASWIYMQSTPAHNIRLQHPHHRTYSVHPEMEENEQIPTPRAPQGPSRFVASSVYSRTQDEEEDEDWDSGLEGRIIDSYKRSKREDGFF